MANSTRAPQQAVKSLAVRIGHSLMIQHDACSYVLMGIEIFFNSKREYDETALQVNESGSFVPYIVYSPHIIFTIEVFGNVA